MCVCVLFVAVFMIVLFVCNRVCVLLISTVSISNLIKSVYTMAFQFAQSQHTHNTVGCIKSIIRVRYLDDVTPSLTATHAFRDLYPGSDHRQCHHDDDGDSPP